MRQKRDRNLHSVLGPHNMAENDKQEMLMDVVSWSPGASIGARDMESLMILLDGSLSFWSISVVSLPKMEKTGSMVDAMRSMWIWLVHLGTATTWDVARNWQMCWDIAETEHCSLPVDPWTFLYCLTRCKEIIQRNTTYLEQILQLCYCVIPSKDSLSRSTCNGSGIQIAQLQHILLTFVLVLSRS